MTEPFADLARTLPDVEVLVGDAAVEPFGWDQLAFRGMPGAVARPRTTEQVAAVLALSAERGFPVVPRAAATNVCGSFVPTPDALLLDTTAMDRIVSVDPGARVAVVEPGVINGRLQERLAPDGLCWSPDPASRPISTVGGNIATNAGGPGCIKYGVTIHHVRTLEVVLADGTVVELTDGDPLDLLGVVVGSEGTLGIVTRATLPLRPVARAAWTALASFDHIQDATTTVSSIIAERIQPSALELIDRRAVQVLDAWQPSGYPTEPEALLFAEVDGEPDEVDVESSRLLAVLRRHDPHLRVARTPEERAALWAPRLSFAIASTAGGRRNLVNDVTVPRQRIPEIVARVREIAARHHLDVPIVAHAGDGNVHPVILYEEHERDAVFAGAAEITDAALDLGGTITGEHGVGSDKLPHMRRRFTPNELGSFRAIARAFDPDGRLNPGVLLPPPADDEPLDRTFASLVADALSGSTPNLAPTRSGPDDTMMVDEENLTVDAGGAARCEDVRALLATRKLRCDALEGDGAVADAVQTPSRRRAVRPSLLAIDAEMAHGRVRFGSAAVKDVAGLDAKRLLTGTGGGPATLLRATFRATPN